MILGVIFLAAETSGTPIHPEHHLLVDAVNPR